MKNLKVGDKVTPVSPAAVDNWSCLKFGSVYEVIQVLDKQDIFVVSTDDGHPWQGPLSWFGKYFKIFEFTSSLPPAVLVQNEREWTLLMDNNKKRGWPTPYAGPDTNWPLCITIGGIVSIVSKLDKYNVLSFADYALIAGIEVPKEEINIELEYGSVKIRPEFKDIEFNNSSGDIESSIWFTDLDKIIEAYQKLK